MESGLIALHSIAEHLDMNLVWLVVTWAFLLSTSVRAAAITAAAEPFGILINGIFLITTSLSPLKP